jgi:hypothetical protein
MSGATYTLTIRPRPEGIDAMLLYEDLARARMREAEQAASKQRVVRRLSSANRWRQVSRWASSRANRAARAL